MSLLEWSEEFSVGVRKLDDQHKELIGTLNELFDAIGEGCEQAILRRQLTRLIDYALTHFMDEEKLMLQCNYAGYQQHKLEHDEFTSKVLALNDRCEAGEPALIAEIANFLTIWFTTHVQGTDKDYVACFSEHGIS